MGRRNALTTCHLAHMFGPRMVSIVIVSFNTVREVLACLASIERSARSLPHEVILVDNASADGTVEAVRARFPAVRLIANDANVGFPKANNQALRLVRGEYVLFLNPDSELEPGTPERLVAELEGFPERAAVGPRVRKPSEFMSHNCARRLPTLWTEFCDLSWLARMFPRSRLLAWKYYAGWDGKTDRDVECLLGAAMLCRTAQVRALRRFDEAVPLYLDDMDLCKRLGAAGMKGACSWTGRGGGRTSRIRCRDYEPSQRRGAACCAPTIRKRVWSSPPVSLSLRERGDEAQDLVGADDQRWEPERCELFTPPRGADSRVASRGGLLVDLDLVSRQVYQPHLRDAGPGVERDLVQTIRCHRGVGHLDDQERVRRARVCGLVTVGTVPEHDDVRLRLLILTQDHWILDTDGSQVAGSTHEERGQTVDARRVTNTNWAHLDDLAVQ